MSPFQVSHQEKDIGVEEFQIAHGKSTWLKQEKVQKLLRESAGGVWELNLSLSPKQPLSVSSMFAHEFWHLSTLLHFACVLFIFQQGLQAATVSAVL